MVGSFFILACENHNEENSAHSNIEVEEPESTEDEIENIIDSELITVENLEVMMVPVYRQVDRLGSQRGDEWSTVFWDNYSFEVPFADYEVEEIEKSDHIDKQISNIHNGVIYTVRLSDYGDEILEDEDFDDGFLFFRHQGFTEGSEILYEKKFLYGPQKSIAIYTCHQYEMDGKSYFEDLFSLKQGRFIFEMTITTRPHHENIELADRFLNSFLIL